MKPLRFLLHISLMALLLTSGVSVRMALHAAPQPKAPNRPPTVALRLTPGVYAATDLAYQWAVDYDSFVWVEIPASQLAVLDAGGWPYELAATTLTIHDFTFDPLQGEPFIPLALRAEFAENEAGFHLIQFIGPIRDNWLQDLRAANLTPLQYYPHNAYLVWGAPAQANSLTKHPHLRWQGRFHPAYKINPDLARLEQGPIENVDVMFYDDGNIDATLDAIERLGGQVWQHYPAQPDRAFYDAIVRIDSSALPAIAQLNTVLWMGYSHPEPILDDEMSAQIIAGNYAAGVPYTGYFDWLAATGYDGSGVVWSIADSGVDYDHPDLASRIVGGYTYPGCPAGDGPGDDPASGGHGTHVAGIVGGDATGGFTDPDGFLYGLGVAPGYSIFAQNPACGSQSSWPPVGGWEELSKRGVLGNAIGANNSWTSGEGTARGYQSTERTHDFMVRDGNFDTPTVAEPYIIVFSAGNKGPAHSTLTAPKEAKNIIVTAGTQNYRVGSDIDAMFNSSSRGPARDGRYVPTIAAPGQMIASTRNDRGGSCSTSIPGTNDLYAYCTGTSMAAPHASGVIVLLADWWRDYHDGADPARRWQRRYWSTARWTLVTSAS